MLWMPEKTSKRVEHKNTWKFKIWVRIFRNTYYQSESMKNLMEIEEVKEIRGNENAIAKLALRRCLERIRKQTGKRWTNRDKSSKIIESRRTNKRPSAINLHRKKTGVNPEYNIRTDRFMIAMEAMEKISNYKTSEYLRNGNAEIENKNSDKQEEANKNENQETA